MDEMLFVFSYEKSNKRDHIIKGLKVEFRKDTRMKILTPLHRKSNKEESSGISYLDAYRVPVNTLGSIVKYSYNSLNK